MASAHSSSLSVLCPTSGRLSLSFLESYILPISQIKKLRSRKEELSLGLNPGRRLYSGLGHVLVPCPLCFSAGPGLLSTGFLGWGYFYVTLTSGQASGEVAWVSCTVSPFSAQSKRAHEHTHSKLVRVPSAMQPELASPLRDLKR